MMMATTRQKMRRNNVYGDICRQGRGPPIMSAAILPFRDHARAPSSTDLKPNADGSATRPRFVSSLVIVKKFSDGIARRARQLLTADMPKPTSAAVAAVPPKASTISSTEFSMAQHNSRSVKKSSVHAAPVDDDTNVTSNNGMDSDTIIARRLDLWLQAQKQSDRKMTAAKICELIDCEENAFSQYRHAKRPLPVEVADALCREFNLTLDWLYRGDARLIDIDLRIHMKKIEDASKAKRKRA